MSCDILLFCFVLFCFVFLVMIPCYYWQVPVTEGGDQRVVPEERPALGEWALKINRS